MSAVSENRSLATLFAPAIVIIGLLFLLPVASFFIRSAAEAGGLKPFGELIWAMLGSGPVQNALGQTVVISFIVTLAALLLGYPIAYFLTVAPPWGFSLVILCIVVPYFTSIIVRTYSWMVLLGRNGLVNQMLLKAGLIDGPLALIYNFTGILIGMVYIMLPYMVLTLYAAMKRIDLGLLRAAAGMGASPAYTFRKVYLPLSAHGVISGSLIVFILCLGFFVTPALMGGPGNVMIAMLIQNEVEIVMNWGSAAAMAVILFVMTVALYVIYYRLSDVDKLMGR